MRATKARSKTVPKDDVTETRDVTTINRDLSSQNLESLRKAHPLLTWTRKKGDSHGEKHDYVVVGVQAKVKGRLTDKAAVKHRKLSSAPGRIWSEKPDAAEGLGPDIVYIGFVPYQSFLTHFPDYYTNDTGLTDTQLSEQGIAIYITGSPRDVLDNLIRQKVLPNDRDAAAAWLAEVGITSKNYKKSQMYANLIAAERDARDQRVDMSLLEVLEIITVAHAVAKRGEGLVTDENGQIVAKVGDEPTHPITNIFTNQVLKWITAQDAENAKDQIINISTMSNKFKPEVSLGDAFKSKENTRSPKRPVNIDIGITVEGKEFNIPAGTIWSDNTEAVEMMVNEIRSVNRNKEKRYKYIVTDLKALKETFESELAVAKAAAERKKSEKKAKKEAKSEKVVKRRDLTGASRKRREETDEEDDDEGSE